MCYNIYEETLESSDKMRLDMIEDNMVVVVPNYLKKEVIKYINGKTELLNIKIMTLDEVKKSLYFSYSEEAILYIMNKYGVKSSIARIYLESMYYTYGEKIDSSKFIFLDNLKKELTDKKLLEFDKIFPLFFNRKFLVMGFDFLDEFYLKMFRNIPNVEIVLNKENEKNELEVVECSSISLECEYVVREICSLIEDGVDISNIKLSWVSDEYTKELKRLSFLYRLPIKFSDNSSIYSSRIVKEFLRLLDEGLSFDNIIEKLKNNFNMTNLDNTYVVNKLIDVCNKYVGLSYDKSSIRELMVYDIKCISNNRVNFSKSIEVVDLTNNDLSDDYVFVLGFNEGKIPTTYKDEEYFSDRELVSLGCSSIFSKNMNLKKSLINSFYGIDHLYLSYSKRDSTGELYPSSLINEYGIKVVNEKIDRSISYSDLHDKLFLTSLLDDYVKYGELRRDLYLLNSNYHIPYKKYDNSFSGISKDKVCSYLKELSLAYSSMDNFYRCGFRYYISNVLKIGSYEETFSIFIGNLFHYILSICFNDGFDFDKEWDDYLLKRELRVDEEFFLVRLKRELLFIIKYLKEFNRNTGFNKILFEKRIAIDKSSSIPVVFKGFVDKIMYKESPYGDLISIIDYKTGNTPINLYTSVYGIGMQLPVYLYLVMKSNIFNNPKIVGIYLQKILNNKYVLDDKKDALKLNGYSLNNEVFLEMFDPGYENSCYIKSMKKSKNGFYSYTKLLDEDDIYALCDLVDEKIDAAVKDVLNGKFDINPKRIGNVNVGCSFCEYRDLCYMKEEDIINLKEYKDLSFLRGRDNA